MENEQVDSERLSLWVEEARDRAGKVERLAAADETIGRVLRYLPAEKTSARWPSDVLSALLQRLASADIERGISMEVHNSRGVTTRSPLDGGTLERGEAELWRTRAASLPKKWSRAIALCNRLAESFDAQAANHDGGGRPTASTLVAIIPRPWLIKRKATT
jgi:hypothetical protein